MFSSAFEFLILLHVISYADPSTRSITRARKRLCPRAPRFPSQSLGQQLYLIKHNFLKNLPRKPLDTLRMGKKQQPFWVFVKDTQRKDEQRGIRKPIGHYQSSLAEVWAKMDTEARKPWFEKAKKINSTPATGFSIPVQGSHGKASVLLNEHSVPVEQEEVDDKTRLAMDMIHHVVTSCGIEGLFKKKWFAGATNVRVKTYEGVYQPLEIGMISYSLEHGTEGKYHQFINPGPVPMGYMSKAMTHCQETHKIPVDGAPSSISSHPQAFDKLFVEIMIFLNDSKIDHNGVQRYLIFCKDDMMEQLEKSLEFIAVTSRNQDFIRLINEGRLIVADIAWLLMELLKAVEEPAYLTLCEDAMNKVSYDFCPGSCDFHEELDNNFCAVGGVRRLWYKFSDAVIAHYGIVPIPDHHLPLADDSAIRVEGPLMVSGDRNQERPGFSGSSRRSVTSSVAESFTTTTDQNNWETDSVMSSVSTHRYRVPDRDPRMRDFVSGPSDPRMRPNEPRRAATGIGRGFRPA